MKKPTKLFFKFVISLTLLFCIADICIAQYDSLSLPQQISFKKEKSFNENPDDDWNLRNFPFQFGLELGTSILRKEDPVNIGFIGSMDINLYDRAMFFRFELGVMSIGEGGGAVRYNEDSKAASGYASLGLNYKIFKIDRSRFFFSLSLGVVKDYWYFYTFTLKYVFVIDKYIGLTSSIKYPFQGRTPFLTIGLQIFTN